MCGVFILYQYTLRILRCFFYLSETWIQQKTAFEPFLWMASFVSGIYPLKYGSLIQENYHHHEPVDPEGIHSI